MKQTDSLKEFIWLQILSIWNDDIIPVERRIYLCTALSEYMNNL